jgi:hypothetical protein
LKYPSTIGVILSLTHENKEELVFAVDTKKGANLWHNAFVNASRMTYLKD